MRFCLTVSAFIVFQASSLLNAQEIESLEKSVDEFAGKVVSIQSEEGLRLYISQIENEFKNKRCTVDRRDQGSVQSLKVDFLYACPSMQALGFRRLVQSGQNSVKDFYYQTRQNSFPVTPDQITQVLSNLDRQISLCQQDDPSQCQLVAPGAVKSSVPSSAAAKE